MKFFNLSFENQELERKFQLQILKQSKKGFKLLQIIPLIMVLILLLDQILKKNIIMALWYLGQGLVLGGYLFISFKYPQLLSHLSSYYYFVDISIGTLQYFYTQFEFLSLEANDIRIYQDILLQSFLIYRTRFSYIGGSLTFIFFIFVRFYIQIAQGFSLSSLAYLFSGSFFIIDQYKQEKFRRKVFLKSQRNQQLQLMIEEFIDDQVSIIEKDSENVRFKTLIFNRKYCEKGEQLIQFLKDVKLPKYNEQLLNYLYQSTNQKETLLGKLQNSNYQITYQSFTLRKQQIFLKIKLLDKQIHKLVNYKELYMHLIQNFQLRPQQKYKGKQIIQSFYMKSFYYQFKKYFQYYKLDLEVISYLFLKQIFNINKIQWISDVYIKPFHSDKKLVFLLVYLIKQIKSNYTLTISVDDNRIMIEFYVVEFISQYYQTQINKILYHIGYHQLYEQISSSKKIQIILIDKYSLEKYY
ncbi:hypothetical protein pb186bvf_013613 [Paramecium bursaria]